MKKTVKSLVCLTAAFMMTTGVSAAKTELYALDGRSIFVEENQIEAYTAPGMGWFLEKPVTMYAEDGRTIVVEAGQVEAYKAVGWFLDGELNKENPSSAPEKEETIPENNKPVVPQTSEASKKVRIKYTDGTVISVPSEHLKMYILVTLDIFR